MPSSLKQFFARLRARWRGELGDKPLIDRDAVETMLERVADRYETDMRRSIKRLLSVFEPVIIVVLGLSVGFIVLLMFMSMMDMQGAAK